jgi:DNA-directed RNA polymerase subunit alpha
MEPMQEVAVNLFAEHSPSLEFIRQVEEWTHCSEAHQMRFTEQLRSAMGKTSPKDCLVVGVGLYLVGRCKEAAEKLAGATDSKEKYVYWAYALRGVGQFPKAIEALTKAAALGADPLAVAMEKVATYRMAKDYTAAEKEIGSCTNYKGVSAEYHYQWGRLQEVQGFYTQALENYQIAVDLAPNHQQALFHLAYRYDLAGDEEAAIGYYQQTTAGSRVSISALLNLAILYEDAGDYEKASQAVDRVLAAYPNHARATLFKKDIESSKTMYFDEEKERTRSQKNQILETPITDFELSVRSRNCLKKMNIRTLGDLLRISESELLSFKNFGETSLKEVKTILESKGLHLGMALEEGGQYSPPEEEAPPPVPEADQGIMGKTADDLQLSVRSRKCLQKLAIRTVGQLTRTTEAELLGCKNFGVTSLNEIKRALASLGLSLRNLD